MFVNAGDRAGRRRQSGSSYLLREVITEGTAASVTFTAIPQTYRDLQLRVRGRLNNAATSANLAIQFNGDTGTNYSWLSTYTFSINSLVSGIVNNTTNIVAGELVAANSPANTGSALYIDIPYYNGITFLKSVQARGGIMRANGGGAGGISSLSFVGWWLKTTAITSVTVAPSGGNFVDNSVVSLYGSF